MYGVWRSHYKAILYDMFFFFNELYSLSEFIGHSARKLSRTTDMYFTLSISMKYNDFITVGFFLD